MLSAIVQYRSYRRKGVRIAWSMSGMGRVASVAIKAAGYLAFALSVIYLLSEQANAVNDAADNRVAAKLRAQDQRIRTLESFLDRCLRVGDNPIWIDGALHFCGLVATGIRR